MLTFAQAAILGLIQGITELFPISSLAHSVIVPQMLGWGIDETLPQFIGFVTATHLATALVLLGFFWRDWVRIIAGVLRSIAKRSLGNDPYARLGWLLIVGTIPAGVLGLLLQKKLQALFAAGAIVGVALVCNGIMLFLADMLRKRAQKEKATDPTLQRLTFGKALLIGIAQTLALIPGFSRTGVTMTGGLLSGLSHEESARFAFLLATPIIFAASLLEVPKVFSTGTVGVALVGALCAAVASYISVRFLTKYFKSNTLLPFAIYCVIVGALVFFSIA